MRAVALAGPSAFAAPARTTTPGTMTVVVTKGKVTDGSKAAKDGASASGTYAFTTESADGAWDPRADGLDVHLGAVGTGLTLSIPPGDAGWKGKGSNLTWKSAKGAPFAASVRLNTTKRTWSVTFSKLTFPALPLRNVYVMFHSAGDGGTATSEWDERKPGNLTAPSAK